MWKLLPVCLVVVTLAACGSTPLDDPPGAPATVAVDGDAGLVLAPDLRVTLGAGRNRVRPPSNLPIQRGVNAWEFVAAFEGDLTGATGDFTQTLGSGSSLRYEGFEATGPGSVEGDFSLIEGYAAMLLGGRRGGFEGGGLLGFGVSVLDLDLRQDGGPRTSTSYDYIGALVGLYARYEPIERLDLYGRASGLFGEEAMSMRLEAGVGFRVTKLIRLFTGLRWLNYDRDGTFTDQTDHLELTGVGLVLGLEFDF